jgi:predicted RNA-binding protein with PUA-like domain
MATLLLKTEPSEYSFDDLVRDKRAVWDGVTNPVALRNLRAAGEGDEVLVYHTGDERRIVGLALIRRAAYEDPKRSGRTGSGEPKFAVVDLEPLRAAPSPVTLAQVKADPRFRDFALVRQGRLSVMPVPPELDRVLRRMAGL